MKESLSRAERYATGHHKRIDKLRNDDLNSLVESVFSAFMYILVKPSEITRNRRRRKRNSSSMGMTDLPKNDRYYFELGAYALFMLDNWHVDNNLKRFRDEIYYTMIIQRFLALFQDSMEQSDLHLVLNNRFELYFNIYSEFRDRAADKISFFFVELGKRAIAGGKPEIHDFDKGFPIMIMSINTDLLLKTELSGFTIHLLPALENAFEYAYGKIKFK